MRTPRTLYGGPPMSIRMITTRLPRKPECSKGHRYQRASNKRLFVVDAFCGANKDTRMAIRFIVEVEAWQALL